MTFYNHIESVRSIAIDLTNGRKWRGASDKDAVFDDLDAARREYMRLSDENAKLRELVKSMYYDLTHMTFPPDWVTDYEADIRELRVEVDE